MSMREYAVGDYGIVLGKDELKKICMNQFANCTQEAWEEDPYGFIEALQDNFDLSWCGRFTGEAIAVGKDGADMDWDSVGFHDESIYYVPIRKYPTLFSGAYECFDDMVDDLKGSMASYVPDDFDFTHVRHIVGTYFG